MQIVNRGECPAWQTRPCGSIPPLPTARARRRVGPANGVRRWHRRFRLAGCLEKGVAHGANMARLLLRNG